MVSLVSVSDWNVTAVGAGAAAIAALITVSRAMSRRRRRQTTARARALGERRIEIVAIDDVKEQNPELQTIRIKTREERS